MTDKERIKELEEEIKKRDQAEDNRKVQSYKEQLSELSRNASWDHGGTAENRLSNIAHFFLCRSEAAEQERDKLLQLVDKIETALEPPHFSEYEYAQYVCDLIIEFREGSQPDGE